MEIKQILEPKNMKILFAIDCSGSVEGHELYHEELNKIWKNITKMMILYIYGIQLILFHMWLFKIRYWKDKSINNNLEGNWGIQSFLIAKIAKQEPEYRVHLLIVVMRRCCYEKKE